MPGSESKSWKATGLLILMAATSQPLLAQLPDPTRPPDYTPEVQASDASAEENRSWVLSSVLISPARRVAVLNGRTVSRGDAIGDAVVIDIKPAQVVLVRDGRELTVQLLPSNVKKDAAKKNKQ